ncbi:Alpha/Beta hydrolase protein [Cyathus striatus]|nr:Alpha/Beta hydrolase protein [Cyathus striatus]
MENIATYKYCKSKGDFTYGYWLVPNLGQGKPSVVLLHGFPSFSLDWELQFTYFAKNGYGVIAPDMLGYGGTDKPLDATAYKAGGLASDLVDILDNEGIAAAIFVSHDWGILPLSRMINLYPERIIANVFISLCYMPPDPKFNVEKLNETIKQMTGESSFERVSKQKMEGFRLASMTLKLPQIDSFYSLVWPEDPAIWKTNIAPKGKLRAWLESDKRCPHSSY